MNVQFPRLSFVEDAKVSIRSIVSVMNDILSTLQGDLRRVARSEVIEMDVSAADAALLVRHNLAAVPTFASGSGEVNAHIYWKAADKREWNDKTIKVRYPSTGRVTIKVETI